MGGFDLNISKWRDGADVIRGLQELYQPQDAATGSRMEDMMWIESDQGRRVTQAYTIVMNEKPSPDDGAENGGIGQQKGQHRYYWSHVLLCRKFRGLMVSLFPRPRLKFNSGVYYVEAQGQKTKRQRKDRARVERATLGSGILHSDHLATGPQSSEGSLCHICYQI